MQYAMPNVVRIVVPDTMSKCQWMSQGMSGCNMQLICNTECGSDCGARFDVEMPVDVAGNVPHACLCMRGIYQ
jgi:hypothetical protein